MILCEFSVVKNVLVNISAKESFIGVKIIGKNLENFFQQIFVCLLTQFFVEIIKFLA